MKVLKAFRQNTLGFVSLLSLPKGKMLELLLSNGYGIPRV